MSTLDLDCFQMYLHFNDKVSILIFTDLLIIDFCWSLFELDIQYVKLKVSMAVVLFSALFSIHFIPVRAIQHLSCVWLLLLPVLSPQLRSVISTPTSFLHFMQSVSLLYSVWPFYCLPSSSTCSIMYALYVSAHFRATHFMSEAVVPIVRDTLTWWGN